jgi:hypothetical protein
MTIDEILEGLKFRIKRLDQIIELTKELPEAIDDLESRRDEINSVYVWIKENSEE